LQSRYYKNNLTITTIRIEKKRNQYAHHITQRTSNLVPCHGNSTIYQLTFFIKKYNRSDGLHTWRNFLDRSKTEEIDVTYYIRKIKGISK